MADVSPSPKTAKREFVIERVFDAPRELVFRAWTDPQQVAVWWGPHHFTNPRCEVDARPGGSIHIDMRGPDGAVHPMKGEFLEVEEPSRLVFVSSAIEDEEGNFALTVRTTVTFADLEGKTQLIMHAEVLKAEDEARWALDGMEEGWNQSLQKLAGFLAT